VQVERLADAVVGRAVERDFGALQAAQRVGERLPVGIADGGVEEAGRAGRWRGAAEAVPGVQADVVMVAARADEGRLRAHPLHQLEAERAAVKIERALKVGDLQVDVADVHAGVNGFTGFHSRAGR
jgi:hypothetical protein